MNFDNQMLMEIVDRGNVAAMAAAFPGQCREGYTLAQNAAIPPVEDITSLILCGMGGSGIGGDLFQAVFSDTLQVPAAVCRHYTLPGWVGRKTLALVCSYSGNTEETLAAYHAAKARQARIICITTGGLLKQLAEADGYPVVIVPAGLIPRAATGYLFMATAVIAARLGLISDFHGDFQETVGILEQLGTEMAIARPLADNWAKQTALKLKNRFPVIYGPGPIGEVLAYRWRCQLNEYSKIPALSHGLPEMCHNEIMGWERLKTLIPNATAILLDDRRAHPRNTLRLNVLTELIEEDVPVIRVAARGESNLARAFSLMYTGDLVSIYLALTDGIDPGVIRYIDYLKIKLGSVKA